MVYLNKHFIKHVPVAERAVLQHERLWRGDHKIGSDYSSFEKHFTSTTYNIEYILYNYMLQNVHQGKWVYELIKNILSGMNFCKFKTLTAQIPSSRMSGEMNTSLGNGFVNLMLFLFLNSNSGNSDYDALVEGDDLIGCYSGIKLQENDYLKLGFTVKLLYYERVSQASFCGLVYDEEDLVSIPDPHKVLLNVGWTSARYLRTSVKTRIQLLRAKGLSLLYQYAGSPIIQSLALCIIRLTHGYAYKLPVHWTHWQKKTFSDKGVIKPVGFRTRMLMESQFGYSVSTQLSLEKYFDEMKQLAPINHPSITDHVTVEQKEYNYRFVTIPQVCSDRPWVMARNLTQREKEIEVLKLTSRVGDLVCHSNNAPFSDFIL